MNLRTEQQQRAMHPRIEKSFRQLLENEDHFPEESAASDSAGRPLTPHELDPISRIQIEEHLDAPLRQKAEEIVTSQLETTGGFQDEWERLIDNIARLSPLMKEMRENVRVHPDTPKTAIENGERQLKLLRLQLEALAKHRARQNLLANLSEGYSPKDLLHHVKKSRELHRERLGSGDNVRERIEGAAMLILRRAEDQLLEEVVKNPERIRELKKERDALMDTILKNTGAIGGTAEVDFKSEAKRTIAEAKLQESNTQISSLTKQYRNLSWFERTFGSGREMKKRLTEMEREQKVLRMQVTTEKVGKALKSDKEKLEPTELPEQNIAPVETTWQLYQAQLASIHSLQEKRKGLSKLPWKDRDEKNRLDALILKSESRANTLKTQHAKEVREQNLARERQEQELRDKLGI